MNVFKPHSITFPSGPTHLWNIENWRPTPGFSNFEQFSASGVTPMLLGVHTRSPAADFETVDLDRILGLLDATFKVVASFTDPVILKWLKKANLGLNVANATTEHVSLSMARSKLTLESLSAQPESIATASCRFIAIAAADGGASIVAATNATLVAPSACNLYTLGPVQINTTAICTEGIRLENGIAHDNRRCNNSIDLSYSAVDRVNQMLTINTTEVDKVMSHFVTPTNVTSVSFFLRKKAANGINVADATTEHIRFAATVAAAHATGPNEVQIRIRDTMAITTAIAVS
jgi:hypothetical protein